MEIECAAVPALGRNVTWVGRRIKVAPRDAKEPLGFVSARSERFEDVPLAVEFRRRSGDVILSRGYPDSRPFPES
jgi:hypothetical protein